jgi:DNA polymerase-3 subunit delta'
MAVWDDLTGQADAIAIFRAAAERPDGVSTGSTYGTGATGTISGTGATGPTGATGTISGTGSTGSISGISTGSTSGSTAASSMTHSWLITGPPGSGRSNLAYAFAAALLSPGTPEGDEAALRQVSARTHPDLTVLTTEGVIIKMDTVKEAVARSQYSPSVGRYRVIVVEDADRMVERTSNVLLKALEEPPERTVWILCAPSEADLLPTIRSRVRTVRLRVPSVEDVADLLIKRDGVDVATAERAAREAQSHIGMAHRLATNSEARARREETLRTALGIRGVSTAVNAAARLLAIAGDDAKAITEERDAEEREGVLRSLGVEPGQSVPPALRSQLKALEDDQKRRATRSLRDGIDRILVDLSSLYRDVMMVQLGREASVINRELLAELRAAAVSSSPAATLATMDAIALARQRIESNVSPALALEAMLVSAIRRQ